MNGLSWFIYFSNIVNTISGWAAALSVIIGALFLLFRIIMVFILAEEVGKKNDQNVLEIKSMQKNMNWIAGPVLLVCIPLALLVPDRQTMILIAGSEIGQRVIQSEAVKGVVDPGLDLIKSWIADETAKYKPKKKD